MDSKVVDLCFCCCTVRDALVTLACLRYRFEAGEASAAGNCRTVWAAASNRVITDKAIRQWEK